jgi:predicted phage terminase large subunit-like protein
MKDALSLAAQDFAAFCALIEPDFELARHTETLVSVLEQVESGDCRRAIVCLPPRHGKSLLCSTLFPAWALGRAPRRLIIGASHGQELADVFGRRVRNLLLDDRFRAVFPSCRLSEDSAAVSRFDTSAGGSYFGIGRGGGLTGRGADLIVVDDPLRDAQEAASPTIRQQLKEWYAAVAYTRLQPGGAVVIVSTRWSLDDLAGWLLREHAEEGWKVLSLPAIAEPGDPLGRAEGEALWPTRYGLAELEKIRAQLGSQAWLALYQGRPVPEGGAIFKAEWLGTFRGEPEFKRRIVSWDTSFGKSASTGDYSAAVVIGESKNNFHILEVVRGRFAFGELRRKMLELNQRFEPVANLIEDTGSGTSAIQELRGSELLPLLPIPARDSKEVRASAISPLFESGLVLLPEQASWKQAFVDELIQFPASAHDDQVDALTQALSWLRSNAGGPLMFGRGPSPREVQESAWRERSRDNFWGPPDEQDFEDDFPSGRDRFRGF